MAKKRARKNNNKVLIAVAVIVLLILVTVIIVLYKTDRLENIIDGILKEMQQGGDNDDTPPSDRNESRGDSYGVIDGLPIKIHFVSVGQGDAIVIELPGNEYMLVDAGSGATAYPSSTIKNRYYSYLSDVVDGDEIDYLVVTHPDSDHVNMMSKVVDDYVVKNFYYNAYADSSKTYATFTAKAAAEEGAALHVIDTADSSRFNIAAGGCTLTFYSPGNDGFTSSEAKIKNGMSIMIMLEYGGRKLLLTGDAPEEEEEWFVAYTEYENTDVDFLKVAHHGSPYSSTTEFLSYVSAEYAVISVDESNNSYGHPSPDTLERLENASATVYRTDIKGTIVLTIDSDGDYAFTFVE